MDDIDKSYSNLEKRLADLEYKVYGSSSSNTKQPEVMSSLVNLGSQLGKACNTRDRIMMVMKRINELERYLDPSFVEDIDLSDNSKLEIILAHEENARNHYHSLQKMVSLKSVLDSQHIANVPSLSDTFCSINQKYTTLNDSVEKQSEAINMLLENYNSIIDTITRTFVEMDAIVTKAELSANPKSDEG